MIGRFLKYTFILFIFSVLSPVFSLFAQNTSTESSVLSLAFAKTSYTLNFTRSLSSFESTLYTALYSSLVTADPRTLQPKVWLAVSWFVSEDKTLYTFNLRKNAKFSDGSPITAEDIKQSWLTNITQRTPFLYLFYDIKGVLDYVHRDGRLEDIGIEVLSDRVIQIQLEQPTDHFLKILTHSIFSVTSQQQLQKEDWDKNATDIIFSGPYVVLQAGESVISLVKNKHYWAETSVDVIQIDLYEESQREGITQEFLDGNIQWTDVYTDEFVSKVDKKFMYSFPLFGTQYMFFKTAEEPWNDPQVRRAIKLLLPLEDLLKKHFVFPATSLVREIPQVYRPPLQGVEKQNIEEAKNLLQEAGFNIQKGKKRGKKLPALTLFVPQYQDGRSNQFFTDVKDVLEEHIDIKVTINMAKAQEYYEKLATEKYTIAVNSWIGDFADPMAFLQMWSYNNEILGSDYNDNQYRAILKESYTVNGQREREFILQQAEKKLLQEAVVIPMRSLHSVEFVRTDLIRGWTPNVLNVHSLPSISFIEQRSFPYITLFRSE